MTLETLKAKISHIVSINAIIGGSVDGTEGVPITFTAAESLGTISEYVWDFGDGGRASGVTAEHTYSSAGNYDVVLRVSGSDGGTSIDRITANILAAAVTIVADAGGPYEQTEGLAITFDGSATVGDGITGYSWDPGDGGDPVTGQTAQYTYASATGSPFTVTLTVSDSGGPADTDTAQVTINAAASNTPPIANANGPYTANVGDPVSFTAKGSYDPDGNLLASWEWDFGDGTTSDQWAPSHAFASAGSPTVTLTVYDPEGASDTDQPTVTINAVAAETVEWMEDAVPLGPWEVELNFPYYPAGFPMVSLGSWKTTSLSDAQLSCFDHLTIKPFRDSQINTAQATAAATTDANGEANGLIYGRRMCPQEYQGLTDGTTNTTSGPQFQSTGASSDLTLSGGTVFAGHWLYKPRSQITNGGVNNTGGLTFTVANGSLFLAGQYLVMYTVTGGNIDWSTAEHAKIASVSGNTITLTARGYKSTAQAHPATTSYAAQHQYGNAGPAETWAFNLSTQCPVDGNGNTASEWRAKWLAQWYNRVGNGSLATATINEVMADSDFGYFYDGGSYGTAGSNSPYDRNCSCANTTTDWGMSPTGVNWWGEGIDSYYLTLETELASIWDNGGATSTHQVSVSGGDPKTNVASSGGCELETLMDGSQIEDQTDPPNWDKVYFAIQACRNHALHRVGPPMNDVFSKINPFSYQNAARFNAAWACFTNGFVSFMNKITATVWPWQDEWAVYLDGVNHGTTVPRTDYSGLKSNKHWLGKPVGPYQRLYDPADFADTENLIANPVFATTPIGTWTSAGGTLAYDETFGYVNSKSLKFTPNITASTAIITGNYVRLPSQSLSAGDNTLCVEIYVEAWRKINITFGDLDCWFLYLEPGWNRLVLPWYQGSSTTANLTVYCGSHNVPIWIGRCYLFAAYGGAVYREFDNGAVVAKCTVDTGRTITLPATWNKLTGSLDATMNDGSTSVSSVTFGTDPDACFLVRDAA